jgi:hypothetical protein
MEERRGYVDIDGADAWQGTVARYPKNGSWLSLWTRSGSNYR